MRNGIGEKGVAAVALVTLALMLLVVMHRAEQWTGKNIPEQLYEAVFVTTDWD